VAKPYQPGWRSAIHWRLVGGTAACAIAFIGIMVYSAWAATHEDRVAAQQPVSRPADPLLVVSPAPPRPAPAPEPKTPDPIVELEKQHQETLAQVAARLEAAEKERDQLLAVKAVPPPPPAPEKNQGCFGTAVAFVSTPAEASQQALREQKLTMVLTISGNFEDSKFT
jgi:hypothetical protein